MSRSSPPILILLVLLPLALLLFRASRRTDEASTAKVDRSTEAAEPTLQLVGGEAPTRRSSARAPAWTDGALIAALAALGEVEGLDDQRLVPRADPILKIPSRVERSLRLLADDRLVDDPISLSLPERGAILALGLASATYGRSGSKMPFEVHRVDRFAFVSQVLTAFPSLRPVVARGLVDLLERLRLAERPVLGPEFLDLLVELREGNPSLGDLFDRLIEQCTAELPPDERQRIASEFAAEENDAELVKIALTELLAGEEGARYLELARTRLEDENTPPDVRNAILEALAVAAPIQDAIDLISREESISSQVMMSQVAARAGGDEALLDAYDERLAFGGSALERENIVFGLMGTGNGQALLDIARTDPDPRVRGRAILMGSLESTSANEEVLAAILDGRDQKDDPFIGLPDASVSSALSNLAMNARRNGKMELMAKATAELTSLVRSPDLSPADRGYALHLLERHLDPEELSALKAELDQGQH